MLIYLLNSARKSIFNKLIYNHDLAVTMRSCSAFNIKPDEAFKTALQTDAKTAKLLLSSDKLDLNYKDSEGNSHLMNILESKNTSLLKSYFNKAKVDSSFKLFPLISNNSGHTIYEIAYSNKKVSDILYSKIAKLQVLNKVEVPSLNDTLPLYSTLYPNLDTSDEMGLSGEVPSAPNALIE